MIQAGAQVEHTEFGPGRVISVLGTVATVNFFGEALDVGADELIVRQGYDKLAAVPINERVTTDLAFRKSFEAMNLGVVPTDPEQLLKLTIGGTDVSSKIRSLLGKAPKSGACRVFMGYYGSGKSHHLQLVKATALREGWVTASLELDPKAADPAKPSSVYQALLTELEFPMRADGTRCADFFDLIKEIRDNWTIVRALPYFRSSPWFSKGLEALQNLSHRRDDPWYVAAVSWLAGQVKQISSIRSVSSSRSGHREAIPLMPQLKDTGLIYAFNLVVLHEVTKALGYKGLAIIIDEAEHVRTYSLNRYVRANNFFDIVSRCAHPPREDLNDPHCDYDIPGLPAFWKEGPHFALFVGLTEGEDTQDLQQKAGDMGVLIHARTDVVHLTAPNAADYEAWSVAFLAETANRLGPKVNLLSDANLRARIAGTLRHYFDQTPASERLLRNWTKMAGFPAAILLSHEDAISGERLVAMTEDAAREVAGEVLPWDG